MMPHERRLYDCIVEMIKAGHGKELHESRS